MSTAKNQKSTFSQRFIRLREARGYSQRELARRMGVPRSIVNYYETRARNPRLSTLRKLAAFFDVPIDYFLTDADKTTVQANIDRVTRLPDAKQQRAGEFLDQLLEEEGPYDSAPADDAPPGN